eukprot:jgi/Undpi1/9510/HiC_scaffold_27.g11966.m1
MHRNADQERPVPLTPVPATPSRNIKIAMILGASMGTSILPASDMSVRIAAHTNRMDWAPSPSPSVWRKRVALEGPQESGRVTSVVLNHATVEGHLIPEGSALKEVS